MGLSPGAFNRFDEQLKHGQPHSEGPQKDSGIVMQLEQLVEQGLDLRISAETATGEVPQAIQKRLDIDRRNSEQSLPVVGTCKFNQ
jgi:hypothetical protein